MANMVITIGRQCGSGGHTIGEMVAKKLGLPFYDKEIVDRVVAKTELSKEFVKEKDEHFYNGSVGHIMGYGSRFDVLLQNGSALTDQLNQVQSEVILELAEKESYVVVGRCADHVLEGKVPTLNVFIYADLPYKIERSVREHNLDPDEAESVLKRRDKARAHHYKFYTDKKWGELERYHLSLDSGKLGVETCVDIIVAAYNSLKNQ